MAGQLGVVEVVDAEHVLRAGVVAEEVEVGRAAVGHRSRDHQSVESEERKNK